jgi:hypothetical protein
MKALSRSIGMLAPAMGLLVVVAPTAGASPTRPVVQTLKAPSAGSGDINPCNGSTVDTTGTGFVETITSGSHTATIWLDHESGDGYTLYQASLGSFTSLSSTYVTPGVLIWINTSDPALDFHYSVEDTMVVNSANAPINDYVSAYDSEACGI